MSAIFYRRMPLKSRKVRKVMVPAQNAVPTRKEHDANLSLEADSTQNFFLDDIVIGHLVSLKSTLW